MKIAEILSRRLTLENVEKVFNRVEEEFRPGWANQFPSSGDILKLSKVKCERCNGEGKYISGTGYDCYCKSCNGKKEIDL